MGELTQSRPHAVTMQGQGQMTGAKNGLLPCRLRARQVCPLGDSWGNKPSLRPRSRLKGRCGGPLGNCPPQMRHLPHHFPFPPHPRRGPFPPSSYQASRGAARSQEAQVPLPGKHSYLRTSTSSPRGPKGACTTRPDPSPPPSLPLAHSAPATRASSLFFLLQGLCTGCPLCLECFSHDILARRTPLHPSRTQLKCHLLKEAPLTSPVTSSPLPTLTPSV